VTVDDLSHLQPPFQEAARLSNAQRIHWLRQERWIQYPRAERILERLIDLVDYPPHDRMPCLVIYGATGMGKTRIIQKFLRENRTHFNRKPGKTRLPVVSIQMPPAPSERDLYEEILAAMGGIFTYGTTVTALRPRIRSLARQLEVRMLVIDEIHSLLAGTLQRAADLPECDPLPRQRPAASSGLCRHARGQAGPDDRPAARRSLRSGRTSGMGERLKFSATAVEFRVHPSAQATL
jgi:hypothetical protein